MANARLKPPSTSRQKFPALLGDITALQSTFPMMDRRHDLAQLLRFDANLSEPVHRWFKFKESFSSGLVRQLLKEYPPVARRPLRFLDPFCGVGTSLLAAEDALSSRCTKLRLRGVEVNPYVAFVARTKLDWDAYNAASLMRAATASLNGVRLPRKPEVPSLSTFQDDRFIPRSDLHRLLDLRDKVRIVARRRPEQRPLLVGLASAAEQLFHLRKDGRALRFTPRLDRLTVDQAVSSTWSGMAEDLQLGRSRPTSDYSVVTGDGRRADRLFGNERFDVIFFSPPYLNNIDYTEVYKLELWLLEFVRSSKAMVAQRRRTFRSHPSCIFPSFSDATTTETMSILGPAFRRLVDYAASQHAWRRRLFCGYFADVLRTLRSCKKLLAADGRIFLVTGNSLHGTAESPVPVATDLWTGVLARAVGLKVDAILVGRDLPRRQAQGDFLRESVLVLSEGSS